MARKAAIFEYFGVFADKVSIHILEKHQWPGPNVTKLFTSVIYKYS